MTRTAIVVLVVLLTLVLPAAAFTDSHEASRADAVGSSPGSPEGRAVPGTVWYQGFLADVSTGDPINDTVEITAELFDAAVDGSSLWGPETHGGVSVVEGWFNIELGSTVSPLPGFDSPPYYLQLTVNGEPMDTRMKLASAPTAIHAGAADGGGGGGIGGGGDAGYIPVFSSGDEITNSNMYQTSGRFSIGTTTSDAKLRVENAGDLPILKLVNTSANAGQFRLVSIERTHANGIEPLLHLATAPSAGNYNLFEIEHTGVPGESLLFWINGNGSVSTYGSIWVDTHSTVGVHSEISNAGWLESGAIVGKNTATEDWEACGVYGDATASDGYGIGGSFWGGNTGVEGRVQTSSNTSIYGVFGQASGGTTATSAGLYGQAHGGGTNYGVYGSADYGTTNWAGYFDGDVNVTGTVTSNKAGFRIDHPDDPANAYLSHAYVASSELKTVYDGTVTLDADGRATVDLPDWFETLNGDVRYQLTPIGGAAPELHIARKLAGGSFDIAGGPAGLEVCWMVTGVRQDAAARVDPLTVEEQKSHEEQGTYTTPEAFGAPRESRVGHRRVDLRRGEE